MLPFYLLSVLSLLTVAEGSINWIPSQRLSSFSVASVALGHLSNIRGGDSASSSSSSISSDTGEEDGEDLSSPATVSGAAAAGSSTTALPSTPKKRIKKRTKSTTTSGSGGVGGEPPADKMPSLFTLPKETIYDRYAACLAATEGLRRARDAALSSSSSSSSSSQLHSPTTGKGNARRSFHLFNRQRGKEYDQQRSLKNQQQDEKYKRAHAQYVLNSGRVIRALGLTVSQFNQLGREIGNDPELKEKVMEQAYLYRMAATLNMDKVPLIEDPTTEQLLKAHRRRRVQMFARSMTEIEDLREEQVEKLKRSLNVDRLPEGINICDPAILPILSPKVRAVCEAFPLQAEEIVKKYGLNSDEFNKMLEEARANPIFRWRVKKYMAKSESESR